MALDHSDLRIASQMVLRMGEDEPVPVDDIKVGYDTLAEWEMQQTRVDNSDLDALLKEGSRIPVAERHPFGAVSGGNPFRDNLGAHEERCKALERELHEALERRDWHASIVLPNDCGAPDRRGRELRRLLCGGQVGAPWWQRFWSWFRKDTYAELDRQLETERREAELRTRFLASIKLPQGGTGIQRPFPQPPPARVVR
jgi:hypothetical protein